MSLPHLQKCGPNDVILKKSSYGKGLKQELQHVCGVRHVLWSNPFLLQMIQVDYVLQMRFVKIGNRGVSGVRYHEFTSSRNNSQLIHELQSSRFNKINKHLQIQFANHPCTINQWYTNGIFSWHICIYTCMSVLCRINLCGKTYHRDLCYGNPSWSKVTKFQHRHLRSDLDPKNTYHPNTVGLRAGMTGCLGIYYIPKHSMHGDC